LLQPLPLLLHYHYYYYYHLYYRQASISFIFHPKEREFVKGFSSLRPSFTRTIAMIATIESPESTHKIPIKVRRNNNNSSSSSRRRRRTTSKGRGIKKSRDMN